jgi:LysM repeat protein
VPKFVADSSVSPTGLKWAVDPVADVVTTAGDLLYATAADTVTRLGIGTAGQVLKVNSGATAPEWGAAGSSGKVLQVVSATNSSAQTTTSTDWADTNLSASITPSATNSKILILTSMRVFHTRNSTFGAAGLRLLRGATRVFGANEASSPQSYYISAADSNTTTIQRSDFVTYSFLDSPNTTSSTTYKIQYAAASGSFTVQHNNDISSIILMEIGA